MSYQHGEARNTPAGIRYENSILKQRLEHAQMVLTKTEKELADARRKLRRFDPSSPSTTPAELARELAKARRLFPEPPEVKAARVTELNRELANADRRAARSTLTIAA